MVTNESITRRAMQLQRRFETRDPFRIAEQLGIDVIYTDQLKHRAALLKRIAGENSEPFLDLNADYDLATVEKMEMEARRNRLKNQREEQKRKKAEKAAAKAAQKQEKQ